MLRQFLQIEFVYIERMGYKIDIIASYRAAAILKGLYRT